MFCKAPTSAAIQHGEQKIISAAAAQQGEKYVISVVLQLLLLS